MARVTLALAIVASLAIATPAARAAGGCHVPKQADVEATSRHVVAYTIARDDGARVLYACLDSRRERVGLKALSDGLRLGPVVAAGSKLAYVVVEDKPGGGNARVRLIDLRHGAGPLTVGWLDSYGGPATIKRLVLAPDGALAYTTRSFWTESGYDYTGPRHEVRTVRAVDQIGHWQMAEGGGIDLRSLERRGRVVGWTDAGVRRSKRFRDLGKCRLPERARFRSYARGVTVYELAAPGEFWGDVHACIATSGEDQLIRRNDSTEYSFNYRIRDHFVAWAVADSSSDDFRVNAYDLDAHALVRDAAVEGASGQGCSSPYVIPDLAVSDQGDVAWTAQIEGTCGRLVTAWDACGRMVLDDDPRVELYSLRIAGRRVLWEVGEEERSAELRSRSECAP
jgi:hypothetical protein